MLALLFDATMRSLERILLHDYVSGCIYGSGGHSQGFCWRCMDRITKKEGSLGGKVYTRSAFKKINIKRGKIYLKPIGGK